MNVLRVKPGVQFETIAPGGFVILATLEGIATLHGVDLEISCGTESHAMPDPHPKGEAYDVSVHGFTPDQIVTLHRALTRELGPDFTVLYEVPVPPVLAALKAIAYVNPHATAPHFHVQVKNGVTYPPGGPAHV